MASGWTSEAGVLIVVIVAVFLFIAFRRATTCNGWYEKINKAWLTFPNWVFALLFAVFLGILAYIWFRANEIDEGNTVTFDATNFLLIFHITALLAWGFFFFGDANVIAGLVLIILAVVALLPLLYFVFDDNLNLGLLILYTLWILYVFYINIAVFVRNKVIPGNMPLWAFLPW